MCLYIQLNRLKYTIYYTCTFDSDSQHWNHLHTGTCGYLVYVEWFIKCGVVKEIFNYPATVYRTQLAC